MPPKGVNSNKAAWNVPVKEEKMLKGSMSKAQGASQKLTKSQKKRLKLERQQEAFQQSLKSKNIETIVYTNPDVMKRNLQASKEPIADSSNDDVSNTPGIEIDMRATRYEIMKFGINSLKSADLEDAETAVAISLGAKPFKRPAINYKELQEQRKKERALEKEADSMSIKPKLNVTMKKKTREKGGKKNVSAKQDKGMKQGGGRSYSGRSSKQPRKRHSK